MPYTIRTKDGIVINNIPDDVPRDSQILKDRVAKARAERGSQPQTQTPQPQGVDEGWTPTQYGFKVRPATFPGSGELTVMSEDNAVWYGPEHGNTEAPGWYTTSGQRAPDDLKKLSTGEQVAEGAKYGVSKSAMGVAQMAALQGMAGPPQQPGAFRTVAIGGIPTMYHAAGSPSAEESAGFAQMVAKREEDFRKKAGIAGAITAEVVDPANWLGMKVAPAVSKGVTGLARLGQAARAGAVAAVPAALARPAVTGESKPASMIREVGLGAVGGAAGDIVINKALGPLVNKTVNMIRGRAASGAVAPAAERFVQDADLLGVTEYTAGQALGGPTKGLEAGMREIPVLGDKAILRRGLEQLTNKVKSIDDRLLGEMKQAGYKGKEDLLEAYAAGDRNARRLVEDVLPKAEDDAYRIMQASTQAEKARRSALVAQEYNQVDDMVKNTGNVDLSGTRTIAQDILKENLDYGGSEIVAKEMKALIDKTATPAGYAETRRLAERLGTKANVMSKSLDPETRSAAYAIRDIRDALRSEMDDHVIRSGVPGATEALQRATKSYKELLVPYKDKAVRDLMETAKPDETISAIINKKGVQHVMENLYPNMGPKGQAAAKYAWFNNKLEKAVQGESFSPATLATELEKDMGKAGVMFKGKEYEEMRALANVLRHMENTRLGDAVINNGLRVAKYGAAGTAAASGATIGIGPTAGIILGLGSFAKFLTQGPGKKWLIASSKVPPGSPEFDAIMQKAFAEMPKVTGLAAVASEKVANAEEQQ